MLRERDDLPHRIADALIARGARVAVAETTAGGLISARLLSVAGASAWFERGVVCYSGAAKQQSTGVDPAVLREHGAVSIPAVSAMAAGLRAKAGVEFALAESGIAGPLGGRRSPKPVGSVVIAVAGPAGVEAADFVLPGTRVQVMDQIADRALAMLYAAATVPVAVPSA
jgi:PncC family amidohydrolase